MYVYRRQKQSDCCLFTVGFYTPEGEWIPEEDCFSKEEAARRVNYLNGGSGDSQKTALIKSVAGHLFVANELLWTHDPDATFDAAKRTIEFVDEILSELK